MLLLKTQVQPPKLDLSPGLETSNTLPWLNSELGKKSSLISAAILFISPTDGRCVF